ncbi:methylmalonyl Co-A mutase-associated GTPase MeaB [Skermanella rosea]|uniref:ArgK/MeaB family GTPase n=1 Tax=Skermanella rosea TaxID=1817965 RepID=UPI001932CC13|nr:GTP-binding protein [Skermanella rosea]UEM04624.1 methylmalonyl Co-A mutase-associated GTPase MeaB [Skermanella rosea]
MSMAGSPSRRRELSRTLSRISRAGVTQTLAGHGDAAPPARPAYRIGITGAPGAGKSTLIARFAARRLERTAGEVAVLAIDPTSPITHGSILGDRVRMDAIAGDPRLYIRSLPSRGSHDGLADNLPDLLLALDRYGFDEALVETVGVGQAEHAVRTLVDTVVLVLHPESGDSVQAMKAGILEIADIYVVNKADLPGARKTAAEIRAVTRRVGDGGAWTPPVILCTQGDDAGLTELDEAVERHRAWAAERRDAGAVRLARARHHAQALLSRRAAELIEESDPALFDGPLEPIYHRILRRLADDLGGK